MSSTVGWILLLVLGGAGAYYVLRPTSSNGPGCPSAGDAAFEKTLASIRTSETTADVAKSVLESYEGLGCSEAAQKVRDAMAAAGMAAPPPAKVYKSGLGGPADKLGKAGPLAGPLGGGAFDLASTAPWSGLRTLPLVERAQALKLVAPVNYAALSDPSKPLCRGTLVPDLDRMESLSGYARPLWATSDADYLAWLTNLTIYDGGPKRFPDGPVMKFVGDPACPTASALASFRDHLAYTGVLTPAAKRDLDAAVEQFTARVAA